MALKQFQNINFLFQLIFGGRTVLVWRRCILNSEPREKGLMRSQMRMPNFRRLEAKDKSTFSSNSSLLGALQSQCQTNAFLESEANAETVYVWVYHNEWSLLITSQWLVLGYICDFTMIRDQNLEIRGVKKFQRRNRIKLQLIENFCKREEAKRAFLEKKAASKARDASCEATSSQESSCGH